MEQKLIDYLRKQHGLIGRFLAFVTGRQPNARHMADVLPSTAEAFFVVLGQESLAPKTYNNKVVLLRSVFNQLKAKASLLQNPFEDFDLKDDDPKGQGPFTVDEFSAIVAAARKPEHSFIRPILFACICTAMRRGDCCLLRWRDVRLDDRFIRIKTAKKGKYAIMPMAPSSGHPGIRQRCTYRPVVESLPRQLMASSTCKHCGNAGGGTARSRSLVQVVKPSGISA